MLHLRSERRLVTLLSSSTTNATSGGSVVEWVYTYLVPFCTPVPPCSPFFANQLCSRKWETILRKQNIYSHQTAKKANRQIIPTTKLAQPGVSFAEPNNWSPLNNIYPIIWYVVCLDLLYNMAVSDFLLLPFLTMILLFTYHHLFSLGFLSSSNELHWRGGTATYG